jgi:hypothetical protein
LLDIVQIYKTPGKKIKPLPFRVEEVLSTVGLFISYPMGN